MDITDIYSRAQLEQFVKKLEEFESKYGVAWVRNKYADFPTKDNPYYEFAKKMHAAYLYRKNGNKTQEKSIHEVVIPRKAFKKLHTDKFGISNHLINSLAGFNGGGGKTASSPEEFYDGWIAFNSKNIRNPKIKAIVEEAATNKGEVIKKVSQFISNREKKGKKHFDRIGLTGKKVKVKRVRPPKPVSKEIIEPSEIVDVYYVTGGGSSTTFRGSASISVVKNGNVFIQKNIEGKTVNEAEYLALIEALRDVGGRKAVIYSNSQLMVFTVTNYYKMKAENLKPLYKQARDLIAGKNIEILWVSDFKNKAVDQNAQRSFRTQQKQKINERRIDISDITLSSEQKELFELLERSNSHYFFTGKAGTGKSVLLQFFRQKSEKNIVICAPTGVAALNIGGQTIHSLFRIPPGFVKKDSLKIEKRTAKLLKHIDAVVIDEVSMVSPDLMDAMDHLLRQAKKCTTPFGGVQMIMFGDLYQLPPVLTDKELYDYFEKNHGGYFFFNAHVWRNTSFTTRELTTIFRQKDESFKIILNAVREGTITDDQLALLNKRTVATPSDGVVILATVNASVARINETRLSKLESKACEYAAEIEGSLEKSAFPADEVLRLKKGAQVMLLKNDKEKRWVNGSIGYVDSLTETTIQVNIDGVKHSIPKETWKKIRYTFNQATNSIEEEVVSSFTQFPIKLAWAITIHKSQGQTYTAVVIDMGRGAFAPGQAYVALSRCRTLEGIYLKRPISREDIIVESKIAEFMKKSVFSKQDKNRC